MSRHTGNSILLVRPLDNQMAQDLTSVLPTAAAEARASLKRHPYRRTHSIACPSCGEPKGRSSTLCVSCFRKVQHKRKPGHGVVTKQREMDSTQAQSTQRMVDAYDSQIKAGRQGRVGVPHQQPVRRTALLCINCHRLTDAYEDVDAPVHPKACPS